MPRVQQHQEAADGNVSVIDASQDDAAAAEADAYDDEADACEDGGGTGGGSGRSGLKHFRYVGQPAAEGDERPVIKPMHILGLAKLRQARARPCLRLAPSVMANHSQACLRMSVHSGRTCRFAPSSPT